jgi:hypothetical protein
MHPLPDPLHNPWTWSAKNAPIVTDALIASLLPVGEEMQRTMYVAGLRDERLRVARLVQALIQEHRATGAPCFELGELLMQIMWGA